MTLTLFYLKSCPYCRKALGYLEELLPQYPDIQLQKIEESEEPKLAAAYDYYYVPCFYDGTAKLHEGAIDKDGVKAVLDQIAKK